MAGFQAAGRTNAPLCIGLVTTLVPVEAEDNAALIEQPIADLFERLGPVIMIYVELIS